MKNETIKEINAYSKEYIFVTQKDIYELIIILEENKKMAVILEDPGAKIQLRCWINEYITSNGLWRLSKSPGRTIAFGFLIAFIVILMLAALIYILMRYFLFKC